MPGKPVSGSFSSEITSALKTYLRVKEYLTPSLPIGFSLGLLETRVNSGTGMTKTSEREAFGQRLRKRLAKEKHRMRLHRGIRHLHGPRQRVAAADEVVLVSLVRDGSYYLDAFFDHYRGLGIRHFAFVDNGSSDDTVERLKQEDGVALLQCRLPWGEFENDLRAYAAQRYGQDRWCLIADMDEIFVFEGQNGNGISNLIQDLASHGYTGLMAQMLEMFPKAPLCEVAHLPYREVLDRFEYCDTTSIKAWSYFAPESGLSYFTQQNLGATDQMQLLYGGIRGKVFGENCCLTKHPLFFLGPDVSPCPHPHVSAGLNLAPWTALIKHYKFANDALERDRLSLASAAISHGEDRLRFDLLQNQPDLSLWSEAAQRYPGFLALQKQGFLCAAGGIEDVENTGTSHD